jgi:hypothetical protein
MRDCTLGNVVDENGASSDEYKAERGERVSGIFLDWAPAQA